MAFKTSRRRFVQTTAAVGIGYWVAGGVRAQESKSPNEQIQFASIGVGGKGQSDSADAGKHGKMVAICDVDDRTLNGAAKRFEGAKLYNDFRKMLEEMGDQIDAVTVSTPDHCHAAASLMAMRMGKHCFCQKPLTHSIYEARLMAQVAKETGVQTMMGNQGTATDGLRKAAALLKAGALGTVTEVHVWTNRPIWPQGGERQPEQPVPPYLHWEEWIGPAPFRPYAPGYHPFSWRGWWDFGTGALGDMACHTMNMPYAGLDLLNPTSVQAETSGHNGDSYPKWSIITYEFPANDWRPALTMKWYDGGKRPPVELFEGFDDPKAPNPSGSLIIGDKGKIYSPHDYGAEFRIIGDNADMEVEFEKSPGHFEEWVRAIKEGKPAMSNFPNYAGPLTEVVLLGNLAVWVAKEPGLGEKVEWDPVNLKVKNIEGLEKIVKPEYRDGYILDA
ncbi:Gfo/Idh/MocA family oxidoreductase [Thermostilla marina]